MALFPEVTIKSKKGSLKLQPLHVDQQLCSVPKSGLPSLNIPPKLGVSYIKTYIYLDISNVQQVSKSQTKALFDLFFDVQDDDNRLEVDVVYFESDDTERHQNCRYQVEGWITHYAIIDPVQDLQRYCNPHWEPSFENWRSDFPIIGGTSYMALLRVEVTGGLRKRARLQ